MPRTVEHTLAALKVLQSVDDQLAELRTKIASLSLGVDEHKKRVAELRAELDRKGEELKADEKDSAMKELELKVVQEKIDKFKQQLNAIKSNKQYAAMMQEISVQEAASSKTEDEALVIMDRIEKARSGIELLRQQIGKAEEDVRREEALVADEVAQVSGQIRELMAERQGLTQRLDRPVIARYDKISRSRGGKACVAVKDGVCQGCFMGVTKQMIARLWSKKELLVCPNCGRIMYLEGEVQ